MQKLKKSSVAKSNDSGELPDKTSTEESKQNDIKEIQNGLLYDIISSAHKYYQYAIKNIENNGNLISQNIVPYIANEKLIFCSPKYYDLYKSEEAEDKYFDYSMLMNSYNKRNIYASNIFRAIMRSNNIQKMNITDTDPQYEIIDTIISKICNGKIGIIRSINDISVANNLINFSPTHYESYMHQCPNLYAASEQGLLSKILYKGPIIKTDYKITNIPKDLQIKFNKITAYFEELKNQLIFDKKTGYYSYEINNTLVPVICRHEYMHLSGLTLQEISIECYRDGRCKYCGQDMVSYNEEVRELMPTKIYSLIYQYIGAINEKIDELALLSVLSKILLNEMQTYKMFNKSQQEMFSFAGIFLYKVYYLTQTKIQYSKINISAFLGKVKEYNTILGRTQKQIDALIKSDEIFTNLKNIEIIIKNLIYTSTQQYNEYNPVSILFNEVINPENIHQLKAKTNIQKLWLEDLNHHKITELNIALMNEFLSSYTFLSHRNKLQKAQLQKISLILENIVTNDDEFGYIYFMLAWNNYCPVNKYHKYKDNRCIYCSIKSDGTNINDVYKRYSTIINSPHMENPKILSEEQFDIAKLYSIKSIEKYNADKFDQHVYIENSLLKNNIIKFIDDISSANLDKIYKCISTITKININELYAIDKSNESSFIKKAFMYIADKKLLTNDSIVSTLTYILMPINNINMVVF